MAPELARLLRRIRDGQPGVPVPDALLDEARALLAAEPLVPPELAAIVFEDDPAEGAGALLGIMGIDDSLGDLLVDAVRAEAGEASLTGIQVHDLVELERVTPWPIAHAVRAEAGRSDLAGVVAHQIGAPILPIREAVAALAGTVDVSAAVAAHTGEALLPLRQAVVASAGALSAHTLPDAVGVHTQDASAALRLELQSAVQQLAGTIHITDAVMAQVTSTVQQAVVAESGEVDVTPEVLAALELQVLPVASAVREEAGVVAVAADVLSVIEQSWVSAMLDRELSGDAHRAAVARLTAEPRSRAAMTAFADLGRSVQTGVREAAGEVEPLWHAVAQEIGIADPEAVAGYEPALLVEALREEAGAPVDVWAGVHAQIRTPVAAGSPLDAPAPANNNWAWVSLMAAAVALFVLSVGGSGTMTPEGSRLAANPISFASADEIKVDDLQYAENTTVQVFQSDEGDGPLIIWVNEETAL